MAADLLTPAEDVRDSLESYNDAMRAIGERVKAGAPVPMFLRSQSALPGLDEPPNKPKPQRAKAEAKPRLKRAAKPRAVGKKRNTSVSRLLENAALSLRMAGFVTYDNFSEYRVAKDRGILPERYFVEHYPHKALYGTVGFKEGFISHNGTEYIFEAKWQNGSGSVDEKLPYLWEHFLESPVANWIVWFDGKWWRDKRGLRAVEWLRDRAQQCPTARRLIILNGKKEGLDFFAAQFGGGL